MTTNNLTEKKEYLGAKGALVETYQKQVAAEQKGYFMVATHIYSWLGPSNYMAHSFALDVIDELEERGMLRHRVKKYANNITHIYKANRLRALEKSERGHSKEASEGDIGLLWDNLCERVFQKVEPHIKMLYWSVNSLLKKEKTRGDLELYTKIFVAHMLFDLALQRYNAFFKVLGETHCGGHNFSDLFPEFCPKSMRDRWADMEDLIIPKNIVPRFNQDDNCKRAFDIIAIKLNDTDILNDSASEALNFDPVFAEKSKRIQEDWLEEQKKILNHE